MVAKPKRPVTYKTTDLKNGKQYLKVTGLNWFEGCHCSKDAITLILQLFLDIWLVRCNRIFLNMDGCRRCIKENRRKLIRNFCFNGLFARKLHLIYIHACFYLILTILIYFNLSPVFILHFYAFKPLYYNSSFPV